MIEMIELNMLEFTGLPKQRRYTANRGRSVTY